MKKLVFLLSCSAALLVSCESNDTQEPMPYRDYKQDMRNFVIGISHAAKSANPNFAIIPQNGIELVSASGAANGMADTAYLNAIDGNGQEDLFYGYDNDNEATPNSVSAYLKHFLDLSKNSGKTILVTDYCSTPSKIESSFGQNTDAGYISYAAVERNLNVIPAAIPNNANSNEITSLDEVQNFLYLINPEDYTSKAAFISAITATDYDLVIMDLFIGDDAFTAAEVNQLRHKANGGSRLVICYMSIGEAEDYRYYWNTAWNSDRPGWLSAENPDWPGNFKVKYWNGEWQDIVYKNPDSYLSKITAAGFDGVYLDIIDGFEYFE